MKDSSNFFQRLNNIVSFSENEKVTSQRENDPLDFFFFLNLIKWFLILIVLIQFTFTSFHFILID